MTDDSDNDDLSEVERTQLLLEGFSPPVKSHLPSRERASAFAATWYARPASGRDKATLALLLAYEISAIKKAAREQAFNDFARNLLRRVRD